MNGNCSELVTSEVAFFVLYCATGTFFLTKMYILRKKTRCFDFFVGESTIKVFEITETFKTTKYERIIISSHNGRCEYLWDCVFLTLHTIAFEFIRESIQLPQG